jgi:hypothetical protein
MTVPAQPVDEMAVKAIINGRAAFPPMPLPSEHTSENFSFLRSEAQTVVTYDVTSAQDALTRLCFLASPTSPSDTASTGKPSTGAEDCSND